jgi:hypothetical protein
LICNGLQQSRRLGQIGWPFASEGHGLARNGMLEGQQGGV